MAQVKLTFTLQAPFPDPPLAPTLCLTPKPQSLTTRNLTYAQQHLLLTEIQFPRYGHDLPALKAIIDCDAFCDAVLGLSHLRRLVFCFAWTDKARTFVQDERIADKLKGLVDAGKLWLEWDECEECDDGDRIVVAHRQFHYCDAVRVFSQRRHADTRS